MTFTYSWRPAADEQDHYVIDGQTPRQHDGDPGRLVWAVCGQRAAPRGEPTGTRCPRCRAWLTGQT